MARDGLLWLHFNLADARALQWLTSANLQVPPQGRALLLSKDTYQQLHTVDDCIYVKVKTMCRLTAPGQSALAAPRLCLSDRNAVSIWASRSTRLVKVK